MKHVAAFLKRYRHVIEYLIVSAWPLVACWAAVRHGGLSASYRGDIDLFATAFMVIQTVVLSFIWLIFGAPVAEKSAHPESVSQPKLYTAENCRWFVESGLWENLSDTDKAGFLACSELVNREEKKEPEVA